MSPAQPMGSLWEEPSQCLSQAWAIGSHCRSQEGEGAPTFPSSWLGWSEHWQRLSPRDHVHLSVLIKQMSIVHLDPRPAFILLFPKSKNDFLSKNLLSETVDVCVCFFFFVVSGNPSSLPPRQGFSV